MKKLISLILAVALVSTISVSAFAKALPDNVNTEGGTKSRDVIATYKPGAAAATVMSVDLAWGSLEYTYTDSSVGTWDPDSEQYINPVAAVWSCEPGANKIDVVNRSNCDIDATFSYVKDAAFQNIEGSFVANDNSPIKNNRVILSSPAKVHSNLTTIVKLKLDGALDSANTAPTKLGTVTVTINEHIWH